MVLEIRKATMSDVAAVALLFDSYRVFYKQASDLPAAFDFLSQRIGNNESVIFIATMGGETVGFVQLYPIFSSVRLKTAWLLNDLFVSEKARRQGIAEALLEQAKELGAETHAAWILLQTGDDNYRAQSVYEKNGWIKVSDFFYEFPLGGGH
ncbi:MAG: GNAT family N-acetyltransferase [Ferruginibacter sp.]